MSRWRQSISVVLGLLLLSSAHGATTTIDFETTSKVAIGELITDQFSDQGIVFENVFGAGDLGLARRDYEVDVLANSVVGLRSGYEAGLRWRFVDPVTGGSRGVDRVTVKMARAQDQFGPIRMNAYDANGSLIVSVDSPPVSGADYVTGYVDSEGSFVGLPESFCGEICRFYLVNNNTYLTIAASGISTVEYVSSGIWPPAVTEMSYEYDTPTATLLFRENRTHAINTFWGPIFGGGLIPGWDHVGLNVDGKVYEAHPGYNVDDKVYESYPNGAGTYVSIDGAERVIPSENTVQAYHSRDTFTHNALKDENPETESLWTEIELDYELGKNLEQKISEVVGASYLELPEGRLGQLLVMGTANQKGGDGTFSCVGLIEWAAESVGHNGSQGFIPQVAEGLFITPDELDYWIEVSDNHPDIWEEFKEGNYLNYIDGYADPVDFLITDPLGRRLGYTEATGELNEIPFAYYSGNGLIESFFIPVTLPGEYSLDLLGLGERAVVEMSTGQYDTIRVDQLMAEGEASTRTFSMSVNEDTKGDVNGDGALNESDVTALLLLVGQAVDALHPGDLDGDSSIAEADVELLKELVEYLEPELTCAGLTPTIVGTSGDDVIYGTEGDDVIKALAGNDTVYGLGGNDTICGGAGDDDLRGGEGDDHIRGNRGADRLSGNKGQDVLRGGRGADYLLGGKGADKLYGRRGKDSLNGGRGFDICRGGKGADTAVRCETVRNAQ